MKNEEDYSEGSVKNKIVFSKKTLIIAIILIIICVGAFMFFHKSSDEEETSIKLTGPDVIYMGQPMNMLIKLKGSSYLDEATTSFYADSDEIISILEDEFYGESGSMTLTPLAVGEDNIHIYTVIGAEADTKTIAEETIHVTVCPKFDYNLLREKEVTISKGVSQDIGLAFDNSKCTLPVSYVSEDEEVVTVNDSGMVTGIESGTTNVKISNGVDTLIVAIKVTE